MRLYWIKVALKPNDWCHSKNRKGKATERRMHVRMEAEILVLFQATAGP